MSKLQALIRNVTGATTHTVATADGPAACPAPSYVVIEEQEGAFYLFRYTREGHCIADTWHLSVEEAKAQAEFEYGIEEADWSEITEYLS